MSHCKLGKLSAYYPSVMSHMPTRTLLSHRIELAPKSNLGLNNGSPPFRTDMTKTLVMYCKSVHVKTVARPSNAAEKAEGNGIKLARATDEFK